MLSEIWDPLPSSTSPYSKNIILKKGVTIDFEVQLDGCYQIALIPKYGNILGENYIINTELSPNAEFQEIYKKIEIKDGNFQLGTFCANPGDDFELKIDELDERLINKKVLLLIHANDAMPSQNLYWATELRPLILKLFIIFLCITLILGAILSYLKIKSR